MLTGLACRGGCPHHLVRLSSRQAISRVCVLLSAQFMARAEAHAERQSGGTALDFTVSEVADLPPRMRALVEDNRVRGWLGRGACGANLVRGVPVHNGGVEQWKGDGMPARGMRN